jgi:peptide/nickel transport system substrate-binding protein
MARFGSRRPAHALAALLVAVSTITAATVAAGPSASAASPSYDPNGVLHYAYDLASIAPVFDPAKATIGDSGTALGQLLYDSLLHKQPNGQLVPSLATAATVVDPSTVKVTLRPNLKFQDGTPLDAAAVKFTIERNRDANSVAFGAAIKDVTSVDVDDPQNVTIHLSKPEAGAFYPLLGDLSTMPVSPTAVAKGDDDPISNPLGAGPFRVKEYVPEQKLTLTKSKTYWNAKNIKLGGVEFVQAATGPPAINALRAGTVDVIGSDLSQLQSLTGGGIKTALGNAGTSILWFNLCKTRQPLDDVKVRQALNYALDRNAINEALASGKGQPAWSLVPPDDGRYDKSLDGVYAYNPKKAKKLLADAGHPNGISLTLIPSPGISGQASEIAQQSWAKAGIKVDIVPSTNIVQDFFTDHKTDMGGASVVRAGLDALQFIYTPGHLGDVCDYSSPELTGMIDQLATLPANDPQATKLWHDAQQFVSKNALSVYGVWLPAVIGYDSAKVGGIKVTFPGVSPYPDFYTAYVKKS